MSYVVKYEETGKALPALNAVRVYQSSLESLEVGFRIVQTPLFSLRDLYAAKDYAYRENLDRRFRPQFELSAQH